MSGVAASSVYPTCRDEPAFEWFVDRLAAQVGADDDLELHLVDGGTTERAASAGPPPWPIASRCAHVAAKPSPYNGAQPADAARFLCRGERAQHRGCSCAQGLRHLRRRRLRDHEAVVGGGAGGRPAGQGGDRGVSQVLGHARCPAACCSAATRTGRVSIRAGRSAMTAARCASAAASCSARASARHASCSCS